MLICKEDFSLGLKIPDLRIRLEETYERLFSTGRKINWQQLSENGLTITMRGRSTSSHKKSIKRIMNALHKRNWVQNKLGLKKKR